MATRAFGNTCFKLGPQQIQKQNRHGINSGLDLDKVNAFRLLKSWNIGLTFAAPALKEWDCGGDKALGGTLLYIQRIREFGGRLQSLSLDEPFGSGSTACGLSADESAARTAAHYARMRAAMPGLEIGDVEPYPHYSAGQLIDWLGRLIAAGGRPDFFHLDINLRALPTRRDADLDFDLRSLQDFLRQQHIPFGVIIWSGRYPERSDEEYFHDAMHFRSLMHAAIGAPDQLIVQSWVTRASTTCSREGRECTSSEPRCTAVDPAHYGARACHSNSRKAGQVFSANPGWSMRWFSYFGAREARAARAARG